MAKLVKTAKMGAMTVGQEAIETASRNGTDVDDSQLLRTVQARLVQAATTAGKTASRLVTCAKVVVCTMEQPESQDQLIRAAKEVSHGVYSNLCLSYRFPPRCTRQPFFGSPINFFTRILHSTSCLLRTYRVKLRVLSLLSKTFIRH